MSFIEKGYDPKKMLWDFTYMGRYHPFSKIVVTAEKQLSTYPFQPLVIWCPPHLCWISPHTPWKTNMTGWKTQPFEDVSPIEKGDFPLSCWFSGGYISKRLL